MAITEENIRGKIGNSIFYRVGSVTRVRSVAAPVSYTHLTLPTTERV